MHAIIKYILKSSHYILFSHKKRTKVKQWKERIMNTKSILYKKQKTPVIEKYQCDFPIIEYIYIYMILMKINLMYEVNIFLLLYSQELLR